MPRSSASSGVFHARAIQPGTPDDSVGTVLSDSGGFSADTDVNATTHCAFPWRRILCLRASRFEDIPAQLWRFEDDHQSCRQLPQTQIFAYDGGRSQVKTPTIFQGQEGLAVRGAPGAYTGTCHKMHLPIIVLTPTPSRTMRDTSRDRSVHDAFA